MRLYKYMEVDAYKALLAQGHLVGSPEHSPFPDFENAYGWLAGMMEQRIGKSPEHANSKWPVFAWATRHGHDPLRFDSVGNDDKSPLFVGFDVPDGKYVLSDFDEWHYVLNNWYLPSMGSYVEDDGGESDRFDAMCEAAGYTTWTPGPRGVCAEVEELRSRHWGRVVDHPDQSGTIQATLWEVRLEWMFLVRVKKGKGIPGHSKRKPTRRRPIRKP